MALSMKRWEGKPALVTGASAGIGAAICVQLVEAGCQVAGLARRKDKVEELANTLKDKKGTLYGVACDVTKEEDILNAFKWVKENLGSVHILVNNAGVIRMTSLIDGDTALWKEIIDTNLTGLCIATREAVRDMRANNVDGHIVHINSIVGHYVVNMPYHNVYPATKHGVTALTEVLRNELNSAGTKIKVSSVSPGVVKTEIAEVALKRSNQTKFPDALQEVMKDVPFLHAKDVADAVTYILSTPPHVQVHELTIKPVGEKF